MASRSALLHPATLTLAGLGFGVYTVVAQARGETTLVLLVGCIALLGLAQLQSRRRVPAQRSAWWEWAAATLTFVLLIGGWELLDEADPTGAAGAPWSLRIVVIVTVAAPMAAAAWLVLRDSSG